MKCNMPMYFYMQQQPPSSHTHTHETTVTYLLLEGCGHHGVQRDDQVLALAPVDRAGHQQVV